MILTNVFFLSVSPTSLLGLSSNHFFLYIRVRFSSSDFLNNSSRGRIFKLFKGVSEASFSFPQSCSPGPWTLKELNKCVLHTGTNKSEVVLIDGKDTRVHDPLHTPKIMK